MTFCSCTKAWTSLRWQKLETNECGCIWRPRVLFSLSSESLFFLIKNKDECKCNADKRMHAHLCWMRVTVTAGMMNELLALTGPISLDEEAAFETQVKARLLFLSEAYQTHLMLILTRPCTSQPHWTEARNNLSWISKPNTHSLNSLWATSVQLYMIKREDQRACVTSCFWN